MRKLKFMCSSDCRALSNIEVRLQVNKNVNCLSPDLPKRLWGQRAISWPVNDFLNDDKHCRGLLITNQPEQWRLNPLSDCPYMYVYRNRLTCINIPDFSQGYSLSRKFRRPMRTQNVFIMHFLYHITHSQIILSLNYASHSYKVAYI